MYDESYPLDEGDNYENNENKEDMTGTFVKSFLDSCSLFIKISNIIRDCNSENSNDIIKKMINDILGNRNDKEFKFDEKIMAPLFEQVINHCNASLEYNRVMEDAENEFEYKQYLKGQS